MSPGGVSGGVRGWLARWQGGRTISRNSVIGFGRKQAYLSETDIFRDLTAEDMAWIGEITTMVTGKKGRTIYSQEEPSEVLFILKKGRVQIYRLTPDGRKLILATLGPGTIFGEMSLAGQHMHSTYAEALDDVTLCVMSRVDVERILIDRPRVALRLLDVLGGRMREMESRLEGIAFKGVPVRLAGLLLELQRRDGPVVDGFSHLQLAEMIGATRETVTKVLDEFRATGLIELGRRRVVVIDSEGLRTIAES